MLNPYDSPKRLGSSGPGWGALITGMVATALVSVGVVAAAGTGDILGLSTPNDQLPLSSLSSSQGLGQPQSQSQTVAPVTHGTAAPDWQSVAQTVRPATVSILVESDTSGATGSGVVYDTSGHIITNHHVVADALDGGTITVTTSDGRLYDASIVGVDKTTDLAVLSLSDDSAALPAARMSMSSELEVGQPVMAVGSPLGLSDTVTTGVISALDRPVTIAASGKVDPLDPQAAAQELVVTNAIQIDASINPGNSGGPLFDATGGVIGINSSIVSNSSSAETAGSIGLGFAIPVDLVKSVADQIIATGSVSHARLGVEIQTATVEAGGATRLGARVATVVPGGAADHAGLEPGDVIVGIDGRSVVSGPALTGFVRRYVSGQEVMLDIVRDGQELQIPVVLKEWN